MSHAEKSSSSLCQSHNNLEEKSHKAGDHMELVQKDCGMDHTPGEMGPEHKGFPEFLLPLNTGEQRSETFMKEIVAD